MIKAGGTFYAEIKFPSAPAIITGSKEVEETPSKQKKGLTLEFAAYFTVIHSFLIQCSIFKHAFRRPFIF